MAKLPKVFLIGHTKIDYNFLYDYLVYTDNLDFLESIETAKSAGCSEFEILCSFYAKLCYKSLKLGDNKNVTRVRDIADNFKGVIDSRHGSVLEHVYFNFVITDCSRVFCYTPDTEVLTKTGWKKITELSTKDLLLTKNEKTHECIWELNQELYSFDYNGEVLSFVNSQIESPRMTPNHIIWAAKYDERKCRSLSNEEIRDKFSQKYELESIFDSRFIIDNKINLTSNFLENIKIGDYTYNAKIFFEFLGLLITDGCIASHKDKRNALVIVQSKEHNIEKIKSIFDILFKDRYKYYHYSNHQFKISDKDLMNWCIENLGPNKYENIFKLLDFHPELLTSLFNGLVLGDGSVHNENEHVVIYTGRKELVDFYQVLASIIGFCCNIRIDDRIGSKSYLKSGKIIENKNISYIASICRKNTILIKHEHKVREIYNGKVYCPKTNNGIIFVRNAGLPFWSGNTHELVRHRVGTSFSQTSGRYVRGDNVELVLDPILTPAANVIDDGQKQIEEIYRNACTALKIDEVKDFTTKKKMTSALRRLLPNGQTNEIGFGVNLRSLRHILLLRTSRHAEWEIRYVFDQVYQIFRERYPNLLYGLKDSNVEGLVELIEE